MFKDKTLLITGGTGSFGNAVLNRFLNTDIGEIRIFSRDEKKQDDMRHKYQRMYPDKAGKIRFFIGDVRDAESIKNAVYGADYVFHAAALKQVPSCEFFPIEAVKTNVLGTENLLNAAVYAEAEKVVCLSTDKAAYPINAMGACKLLMEKTAVAKARAIGTRKTGIVCTRYGNILCSRGSVVPLWIEQIKRGETITLTEPKMTRFIMSADEAMELLMFSFENGVNGDIMVQKASACTVGDLAAAVKEIFDEEDKSPVRIIGARHGEKLCETLLTDEEYAAADDLGNYYRIPADGRSLNYDDTADVEAEAEIKGGFNSENTRLLTVGQIKEKLLSIKYIQDRL